MRPATDPAAAPMDPHTPTTPVPAPPRRRGCWGCLFHGGLGCVAFLSGSVLAAVLFAPSLLVGPIGRLLERGINGQIAGRVDVQELDLAWNRGQHAVFELFDPDDQHVGRFEVRLPSLWSLLRFDQGAWRLRVWATEVLVKVRDDGTNNLAAALADPDGETQWWNLGRRLLGAEEGYATSFGYQFELDGDEVVIEGLADELVVLRELSARLDRDPNGRDGLRLAAKVVEGPDLERLTARGDFEGSFEFSSPRAGSRVRAPWSAAPELIAQLTWNELSAATAARLVDLPLAELFGAEFGGTLSVAGQASEGFGVTLAVDGDALVFTGRWKDGHLIGAGEELGGAVQVPVAWFEDALGPRLPSGTALSTDDAAWTIRGSQVRLPIGLPGEPWPARRDLLAGLRGIYELHAPLYLQLVDADDSDGERGAPLADLSGATLRLALSESEDLVLELQTAFPVGPPGGPVRSATGLLRGRGDLARTLDEGVRSVSLSTVGIGLLLLDHLRGDVILSNLFDPDTAELDLDVGSDGAWLTLREDERGGSLRGRLENGVLVGDPEGRATLPLDLTRAPVRELVEVLVPWMEELEAVPGGEGPRLYLRGFRLPLLGPLREGEGVLHLDLGQVRYRMTPGFYRSFQSEGQTGEPPLVETWMPRIRMRLERQILTYDELTLIPREDEEELDVGAGSMDLLSGKIDLDCELPLRMVLSNVLPGAEETLIPVNLDEHWSRPKKNLDTEVFLQVSRMIEALGKSDGQ